MYEKASLLDNQMPDIVKYFQQNVKNQGSLKFRNLEIKGLLLPFLMKSAKLINLITNLYHENKTSISVHLTVDACVKFNLDLNYFILRAT